MLSNLPTQRAGHRPRAAWVGATVLSLGFLFGSSAAFAVAPPANTVIGNQASASYADATGTTQVATSNLVQTTVQQVGSFTLDTVNQLTSTVVNTKTGAVSTVVYAPHILTNTGNGSDTFTISVTDDKARAFYNALFGWSTNAMPMGAGEPYPMILNGGEGIGGYRQATGKVATHWVAYLSVPDVDASFKSVSEQGCRTMLAPTDFGPGRMAAVADPTGAGFALWKGADGDRPDQPAAVGDWHWCELWTTDAGKALAFYERTFGFASSAMPMEQGEYHILAKDGMGRAGLMQSTEPAAGSMWLPYVAVADCDAIVAKASGLGAKTVVPPTDIPEVGRFAVLIDPFGAAIGVIKPASA